MQIGKIKTKLGTITVEETGYMKSGYPGYYVSLKDEDNKPLAEVLLEVDETDEKPECKIHVWDTTKEDPIFDLRGCAAGNSLELVEY